MVNPSELDIIKRMDEASWRQYCATEFETVKRNQAFNRNILFGMATAIGLAVLEKIVDFVAAGGLAAP